MSSIVASRSSSFAPFQSLQVTDWATDPATIWPTGSVPEMSTTSPERSFPAPPSPSSEPQPASAAGSRSSAAAPTAAARRMSAAWAVRDLARERLDPVAQRPAGHQPVLRPSLRGRGGAARLGRRVPPAAPGRADAVGLPLAVAGEKARRLARVAVGAAGAAGAILRQEAGHRLVRGRPERRVRREAVTRPVRPLVVEPAVAGVGSGLVPPE